MVQKHIQNSCFGQDVSTRVHFFEAILLSGK